MVPRDFRLEIPWRGILPKLKIVIKTQKLTSRLNKFNWSSNRLPTKNKMANWYSQGTEKL